MRLLHLTAAVLVTCAAFLSQAFGQGTPNQLPEPVSTSELHAYMRRYVHPTQTQWDAIEGLHDDYRDAFRTLREGDIERFLKETRSLQLGGIPQRDVLEKFLRDHERLLKRIAELDATLFDGIAVVAGDDRRADVERAGNARARDRERSGGVMGGNFVAGGLDLSELAIDQLADKEPAALAAITPELVNYEIRLTALTRAVGDESRSMFERMFEELERIGLTGLSQEELMADPERMEEMMKAMQEAFRTIGEKVQKKGKEIRELNDRTMRSIGSKLEGSSNPDVARRLRRSYLVKAHPMVGIDASTERVLRTVLRSSKLDDDARARLGAELEAFVRADDALVDQMVTIDGKAQDSANLFDYGGEDWQARQEALQEVQSKRQELAARTLASVQGVVGDERFARISEHATAKARTQDPYEDAGDPEAGQPAEAITVGGATPEMAHGPRAAIPSSMPVAEIQALAGSLGLDAGGRSVLETMHAEYVKRWSAEVQPLVEEGRQLAQRPWIEDGAGGWKQDTASISLSFEKRIAALKRNEEVDDAFFADAGSALGDRHAAGLALARLHRALALDAVVAASPNEWTMGAWSGSERPLRVNMVELLEGPALPDSGRDAARQALADLAPRTIDALRAIERDLLAAEQAQQRQWSDWQDRQRETPGDAASGIEWTRMLADAQRRSAELGERRDKLDMELMEAIVSAVGDGHRESLELARDRAAYPQIFHDPRSALPFIDRASDLPDLSPEQRTQLDALRDGYERDHIAACRRMIIRQAPPSPDARPEATFVEASRVQSERAKVQFDRDERSARAVSELRRILTSEQASRIPGLGDYERSKAADGSGLPYQ